MIKKKREYKMITSSDTIGDRFGKMITRHGMDGWYPLSPVTYNLGFQCLLTREVDVTKTTAAQMIVDDFYDESGTDFDKSQLLASRYQVSEAHITQLVSLDLKEKQKLARGVR